MTWPTLPLGHSGSLSLPPSAWIPRQSSRAPLPCAHCCDTCDTISKNKCLQAPGPVGASPVAEGEEEPWSPSTLALAGVLRGSLEVSTRLLKFARGGYKKLLAYLESF